MPFIPTPGGARFVLSYFLHGQPIANVLNAARSGSWNAGNMATFAEDLFDLWSAQVMPHLSADLSFVGVRGYDLSAVDAAVASYTPSSPTVGGVANPALPGNVAYCLTFRTDRRGRNWRGRIYIPGLPENVTNGNLVTQSWSSSVEGGVEAVRASFAVAGTPLIVLSQYFNKLPRPVGEAAPIIDVVASDLRVDSQRRRLS